MDPADETMRSLDKRDLRRMRRAIEQRVTAVTWPMLGLSVVMLVSGIRHAATIGASLWDAVSVMWAVALLLCVTWQLRRRREDLLVVERGLEALYTYARRNGLERWVLARRRTRGKSREGRAK